MKLKFPVFVPVFLLFSLLRLPEISIPATSQPVRIDGRLDDPAWRGAAVVRMRDNQTGKSPAQKTTVRLIHNRDVLFVGFDCADRSIAASMTRRDDDLWKEEAVEIFLDPAGDGREYLEIEVNPLGAVYDAWIRYSADIDFDKAKEFNLRSLRAMTEIIRSAGVKSEDKRWTCEIAIPLSELPSRLSNTFRLNLTRIDRHERKHVYYAWSPTYRWFHVPERFGKARLR